jgi:hypothetical protein
MPIAHTHLWVVLFQRLEIRYILVYTPTVSACSLRAGVHIQHLPPISIEASNIQCSRHSSSPKSYHQLQFT